MRGIDGYEVLEKCPTPQTQTSEEVARDCFAAADRDED